MTTHLRLRSGKTPRDVHAAYAESVGRLEDPPRTQSDLFRVLDAEGLCAEDADFVWVSWSWALGDSEDPETELELR